jgi:hypothetical protein
MGMLSHAVKESGVLECDSLSLGSSYSHLFETSLPEDTMKVWFRTAVRLADADTL